jgi:hypothetical protein
LWTVFKTSFSTVRSLRKKRRESGERMMEDSTFYGRGIWRIAGFAGS